MTQKDYVDIVFGAPPSEGGSFVQLEDADGQDAKIGNWMRRSDGRFVLRVWRGEIPAPSANRRLLWGAALLTAAWIAVGLWLAKWHWGFSKFDEPNKFGDYLAGMFAPVAFAWLAIAVILQRDELIAQREQLRQNGVALKQQAEELRATVRELELQTAQMTAATEAQLHSYTVQGVTLARRRLAQYLTAVHQRELLRGTAGRLSSSFEITARRFEAHVEDANFIAGFNFFLDELRKVRSGVEKRTSTDHPSMSPVIGSEALAVLKEICKKAQLGISHYHNTAKQLPRFKDYRDIGEEIEFETILNSIQSCYNEVYQLADAEIRRRESEVEPPDGRAGPT